MAPVPDHATGHQKLLGHLAALLFAVLIAGSFSIGDLAVSHIAPAALNAVRFAIAVAIIAAVAIAVHRHGLPAPNAPWRYALLGGLLATYFILMFVALKIAEPVSTGAVFTLIPLMSAGFGYLFLRHRTGPAVWVALLIAASGAIWVIFRGDIDAILGLRIGKGEAVFFVGCACHAAYAPLVRKLNRGEPLLFFTFYTLAATAVWISLVGSRDLVAMDWAALPTIVWWAVAYLSVITTAGTLFLIQFASLRLPASKVLSYGYLTPTCVILIEGAIGHGWPTWSVLAGALLTACALVVMALAPDT